MTIISSRELGDHSFADAQTTVRNVPTTSAQPLTPQAAAPVARPSSLDVWTAAFSVNNSISGLYESLANPYTGTKEFDRDFSPRRLATQEGYAEYADEFTNARNRSEYEFIKQRVDQTKQSKQVLENASLGESIGAQMTAAILDPVGMALMAVPVAGEARIAQVGSQAARIALRAGSYTATGIATAATQQGVLNQVRPTSEQDQVSTLYGATGTGTAVAVGFGVTAALFGTVGRGVSAATKNQVRQAIEELVVNPDGTIAKLAEATGAAAKPLDDASTKLYKNAATKAALKSNPNFNQGLGMKLAESPISAFRTWGMQITPDVMQREGTKQGVAHLDNVRLRVMHETNSALNNFGYEMVKVKKSLDSLGDLTPAQQQEIFDQLRLMGVKVEHPSDITPAVVQHYASELVGYATQNGARHVLPEVDGAAKKLASIFQRDADRINLSGVLGLGPDGLPIQLSGGSYFSRVFNKGAVAINQLQWIDDISKPIEARLISVGMRPDEAAKAAKEVAMQASNKITSSGSRGTGSELLELLSNVGPQGKLAARSLDLPYEVLAPYLEHDALKVLHAYKRSVEPQIALQEVFGYHSFNDFRNNVMAPEYDRLKQALRERVNTATPEEKIQINTELLGFDNEWKKGEEILKELFDGTLGRTNMSERAHKKIASVGRVARMTGSMIMLSGQVVSSLPELAKHIGTHGLIPAMKTWAVYLGSSEFRNMSRETASRIGVLQELLAFKNKVASDMSIAGIDREMLELTPGAMGTIEKYAHMGTEGFQWINGAMLWNDSIRNMTVTMAEDRLLRTASKEWKKLGRKDREWLLVMGVDEQMHEKIGKGMQGKYQKTKGFYHTDVDSWTDPEAAYAFKMAALKDAHTTASTPFQGTMPGWYDSEWGKFVLQFKSFLYANYQQTLIPYLQRNDANVWQGVVAATALGMAVAELKDITSAAPPQNKTIEAQVFDGIERSGMVDMPFMIYGYLNALYSSTFQEAIPLAEGIKSMTGLDFKGTDSTNRRPKGFVDAAMGPTAGILQKAGETANEVQERGMTEKAQQGIADVTPFHKIGGVDIGRMLIESLHGHTRYIDNMVNKLGFTKDFGE